MMRELLWPCAKNQDGRVIRAEDADRGRYSCLECGASMCLRYGENVRRHFAHVVEGTGCSGESAEHRSAKALIAQVYQDWISDAGGPRPMVARTCRKCSRTHMRGIEMVDCGVVQQEYRAGNVVVDVVVLKPDETPRLFVEVHYRHAVDSDKKRALDLFGVSWIEVEARDVHQDPYWLRPVNGSPNLPIPECYICKAYRAEAQLKETIRIEEFSEWVKKMIAALNDPT